MVNSKLPTNLELDSDIVKAIHKIACHLCKKQGFFNPPTIDHTWLVLNALLLFANEVKRGG